MISHDTAPNLRWVLISFFHCFVWYQIYFITLLSTGMSTRCRTVLFVLYGGLMSKSTNFHSCWAIASYFGELMRLAQGYNMVPPVGIEPRTSPFSPLLYHYTTELPWSVLFGLIMTWIQMPTYLQSSLLMAHQQLLSHMEMGPLLKVPSDRLEKPEIEPATPGL